MPSCKNGLTSTARRLDLFDAIHLPAERDIHVGFIIVTISLSQYLLLHICSVAESAYIKVLYCKADAGFLL
jgi:hypothetical protein